MLIQVLIIITVMALIAYTISRNEVREKRRIQEEIAHWNEQQKQKVEEDELLITDHPQ